MLQATPCLLVCAVVILVVYLLTGKRRTKPEGTPPYPSPPWFYLGHLGQMTSNCRLKMRAWRATAGDVYSLDFAGQNYIVVNGYAAFKEVLVHHADCVQEVPHSFMSQILREHNKGIAESNGANWQEQRKAALSILRYLGLGKNVMAERIQDEVAVYLDKLASHKGAAIDVRLLTTISVSNIICSMIVGRRFEHDDPYFTCLVNNMGKATKYFANLPLLTIFPWLYHLPGDSFKAKELVSIFKEINSTFSQRHIDIIQRSIQERDSDKLENFIAFYLSKMNKKRLEGKPTNMDVENLIAVIRNLFIAGTDTASGNILWFFLYMLHYPEIQEKIFREISLQVGMDRRIELEDMVRLPYLNAVVMETQRHACVTPFASPRVVTKAFQSHGYVFPVGSHVLPNLDSVQHDHAIWEQPDKFRPERFLDEHGNLLQPEEFIPFSLGRRVCLGESMAKMELFMFFSRVLQRFQLKPAVDNELTPLEEVFGAICCPQQYELQPLPTSSYNLYQHPVTTSTDIQLQPLPTSSYNLYRHPVTTSTDIQLQPLPTSSYNLYQPPVTTSTNIQLQPLPTSSYNLYQHPVTTSTNIQLQPLPTSSYNLYRHSVTTSTNIQLQPLPTSSYNLYQHPVTTATNSQLQPLPTSSYNLYQHPVTTSTNIQLQPLPTSSYISRHPVTTFPDIQLQPLPTSSYNISRHPVTTSTKIQLQLFPTSSNNLYQHPVITPTNIQLQPLPTSSYNLYQHTVITPTNIQLQPLPTPSYSKCRYLCLSFIKPLPMLHK
ncbi:cytochrome P450 2 sub U member 1 [Bulinus truncatus]|nr:cytochrome P450 2 sub U member 1 [Bulinus truncatus]